MRRSSLRSRMRSRFSSSLEKRLNLYSLAASGAGLSVLTLGSSAEARIVYTPANVNITLNGGLIRFDLDHDGIPEFGFSNTYFHSSFQANGLVKIEQTQSVNEVWEVTSQRFACAAALPRNTVIGPRGHFERDPKSGLIMAFSNLEGTYGGPWRKVSQAYLGLKFEINGKTHFGWARVKGTFNSFPYTAILTGYAYETIPNKPIIAGQTHGTDVVLKHSTLGELAAGRK